MSLLVSELSFTGEEREAPKTAVLTASLVSGLLAAAFLGARNRAYR